MTSEHRPDEPAPIEGAPTWIRVVEAALIGVVAGLALNALLSMVVVHGESTRKPAAAPTECRRSQPARDAAAPSSSAPQVSGLTWTLETVQARR